MLRHRFEDDVGVVPVADPEVFDHWGELYPVAEDVCGDVVTGAYVFPGRGEHGCSPPFPAH